jgi:hypothetical protein
MVVITLVQSLDIFTCTVVHFVLPNPIDRVEAFLVLDRIQLYHWAVSMRYPESLSP